MVHIKYNSRWRPKDYSAPFPEEIRLSIREQVIALSNNDLLDEYTSFAAGDDYDGCHTSQGAIVWQELEEEFRKRLFAVGWLEEISDG